ncbi:hypothetical protein E0F15_21265 [Frankia sp. B2]|uniref:hypothetical protein n=1 Tax=Frankia sp. B2 TaxID=2541730 RepID=UPI00106C114A|nr:hypothetical protein [Frankia sp. B2]TFE24621.1 hypothetical protein E0F15_21265 [Frankia sp. B2]
MPYTNENASRLGHVIAARSPVIADAMARWSTPSVSDQDPPEVTKRCISLDSLPDLSPPPTYAIAFDGSNQEVEARAGYPSVRVGFVQIAGAYIDIEDFLTARTMGLVDARRLERAQITQTVNSVLPGSNVYLPGANGVNSWRIELSSSFDSQQITDFGDPFSLTDALLTIQGTPGSPLNSLALGASGCPGCGDGGQNASVGGSKCTACGEVIYPTDWLRTHEEYSEDGSNLTVLTRTMNVAERLLSVSYIDGFFRVRPELLGAGIFITDGPLSFYGTTAKLKTQMLNYWGSLCTNLRLKELEPPLLVGIEKSGRFADHANSVSDFIPDGHVMVLDTPYINRYIVNQNADHFYGKDEFYGRRFFYKTTNGDMLVVTLPRTPAGPPYEQPRLSESVSSGLPSEDIASYPTLRRTLETLDRLQTRLYPNAVIPVALAHSASSLPLGTGRSVLTLLAQKQLGLERDSISLSRLQPPRY